MEGFWIRTVSRQTIFLVDRSRALRFDTPSRIPSLALITDLADRYDEIMWTRYYLADAVEQLRVLPC
jgi:hypothetical protein